MCESKMIENLSNNSCEILEFNQNFLENLHKDIFYVNSKIKIKKIENETQQSPTVCFDEIPKKLKDQISLPVTDIDKLCFYETLIISKGLQEDTKYALDILKNPENLAEVGSAVVMLEELYDGTILVFTTKQTFINEEKVCNECLSIITKDLKLIHEKIIETTCTKNTLKEKSLFIMRTDSGYHLVKTLKRDNFTEQFEADVEWKKTGDFLSHGANILLIRWLIINKFKGSLHSYCCDIDGEFALCQYWFHNAEYKLLNGKNIPIKRVDQVMFFKNNEKFVKIARFYSLSTLQMLKESIDNLRYFTHINPLTPKQKYTKYLRENWKSDVQLMASYLEFKAKRKEELKKKFESPNMKVIFRDFIRILIKCKPQNIMNFTMEFIEKLEQNGSDVNVQMQILKTADRRYQQN